MCVKLQKNNYTRLVTIALTHHAFSKYSDPHKRTSGYLNEKKITLATLIQITTQSYDWTSLTVKEESAERLKVKQCFNNRATVNFLRRKLGY